MHSTGLIAAVMAAPTGADAGGYREAAASAASAEAGEDVLRERLCVWPLCSPPPPAPYGVACAEPTWRRIMREQPKYAVLEKYFDGLTDADTRKLFAEDLAEDAAPVHKPRMRLFVAELSAAGALYDAARERYSAAVLAAGMVRRGPADALQLSLRGLVHGTFTSSLARHDGRLLLSSHEDVADAVRKWQTRADGGSGGAGAGATSRPIILDISTSNLSDDDMRDICAVAEKLKASVSSLTLVLRVNRFLGGAPEFWTNLRALLSKPHVLWVDMFGNPAVHGNKTELGALAAGVERGADSPLAKLVLLPADDVNRGAWHGLFDEPLRSMVREAHRRYYGMG